MLQFEVSELLSSIRHTGDVFLEATASILATFVLLISGAFYLVLDRGEELRKVDDVFKQQAIAFSTIGLLFTVVLCVSLAFQAHKNRAVTKARIERIQLCLTEMQCIGSRNGAPIDVRLLSIQGSNGIFTTVIFVTSTFTCLFISVFAWFVTTVSNQP